MCRKAAFMAKMKWNEDGYLEIMPGKYDNRVDLKAITKMAKLARDRPEPCLTQVIPSIRSGHQNMASKYNKKSVLQRAI